MCHKTLFLSISAPPSLPQQNRTAPPSQTKPSLHLPLCLIGASKLLNTKRLKSSASRPPLLAIKFSQSDQRCRQVTGIVAELARTMAENGVAIPSDENDAPTSVSDASDSSTFGNSSTTLDNKDMHALDKKTIRSQTGQQYGIILCLNKRQLYVIILWDYFMLE